MGLLERKRPRNFKAVVQDKEGNKYTFIGKGCTVRNKRFRQRLGIGDVEEIISCVQVEIEQMKKRERKNEP